MEPTKRDQAILIIKKLLAMAEHAGSNEHEALIAAGRAESMMRKYTVDYAEVIAAEIKTGVSIVSKTTIATAKDNGTATKKTPSWAQQIAVRVGELFDTPVRLDWVTTGKGREEAVRFHGYVYDVDVAIWTYDVLIASINRVCKAYRNDPHYLRYGRTVMNAYRLGVVHSVLQTLSQMVNAKNAEVASTSTALVLIKRKGIEDKFGTFTYRQAKPPTVKSASAYHTGREDGRNIAVQTAIEGVEEPRSLAAGA